MGLSDYKRATKVAARSTGSWVSAFISVLWARTKFGIGPRYHSLFEFGKRRVGEWDCYIPDSESNPIIRKLNGEDLSLAVDKEKFASHCINNMLPTIPILAVVTNKVKGHVSGVVRISKSEELDSFLKDCPDGIFIKLSDGAHGDGAIVAYREGLCWRFDEKVGDAQELMRFLRRSPYEGRDWLIQPLLSPHNELKKIMGAGSLGTVRAITYMKDGQAKVILPLLRIPAGENITDNFSEGSKGNVVASVDLVTGVLSCGRMSITRSWPDMIDVRFHPDTAIKIEGFVIPYWKEAMELLLRAQLATPQLRTLGWDLAITDSGPVIVEVNTGYDSNLVQVAYGRGIRRDMAEIIGMSQILEGRAPE